MRIGIAVVALSVGLGASAASAQPGYGYGYGYGYRYGSPYGGEGYGPRAYYAPLAARHLIAAVREAGLRPVSHPMRAGRDYIIDAVDRNGDLRRVFIDGYSGQVMRVAAVSRPDYPPPARRPRWRDPDGGLRPPARVPSEPEVIGPNDSRLGDDYDEEPPMRPQARIPAGRERIERRNGPVPNAEIPRPPAPLDRRAVKPAPAKPERTTARSNDAAPSSPAAKPKPPAARTASPRVILPGGPQAKTESAKPESAKTDAAPTAATSPSLDGEKPPAPAPAPGATLPPMQPLD